MRLTADRRPTSVVSTVASGAAAVITIALCGFLYFFTDILTPPHPSPSPARLAQAHAQLLQIARAEIRRASAHCSESPTQLKELMLRHRDQLNIVGRDTLPAAGFVRAVEEGARHHDSTATCAPTIDSVAAHMPHRGVPHRGARHNAGRAVAP